MAINSQLFNAASIIYQALLTHQTNLLPDDPMHAQRAKMLAERLFEASSQNTTVTLAAARAVAGFMKNTRSQHATDEELINLGMTGVGYLVQCFQQIAIEPPKHATRRVVARSTQQPPQMPPQPVAMPVQFTPVVPPAPPIDVPDFSDGSSNDSNP
jgi:hypothetical protein